MSEQSNITQLKLKCTMVSKPSGTESEHVEFNAVYDGSQDNEGWSKYTPSGKLAFVVTNPNVFGKFEPGQDYLISIKACEK